MEYTQDSLNILANTYKGQGTEYDTTGQIIQGYGISKAWSLLEYLYRESWQCKKVVDFYPDKMIRGWGHLGLADNPELVEETKSQFDRLKTLYNQGQKVANLYGDGYVIRFIDDGRSIDQPVNLEDIRDIKYSRVYDYREVQPKYTGDISDAVDYYNPEHYYFFHVTNQPSNFVHKDRIMRFKGDFLPPTSFERNNYSYASVLEPFITPYMRINQSLAHIAEAMTSFEVLLFGIEGLFEDLMNGDPTQRANVKHRYELAQKQISSMRGAVHDKDQETITIAERKFNNISNIIEEVFRKELIAASGLTKTQLYKEHPSGLNSTGKSQLLAEATRTMELQEIKWGDLIEWDTQLIMAQNQVKEGFTWQWSSIYQPTKDEELVNKKTTAETDKIYTELGVLTPEEIRNRFAGSEYQEDLVLKETNINNSLNQDVLDTPEPTDKFIPEGNVILTSDYAPIQLEDLENVEDD